MIIFWLISIFLVHLSEGKSSPPPIVMWHGMGDCCCNPLRFIILPCISYPFLKQIKIISMGSVKKYFEDSIPGVYVLSLMLGDNVVQDTENGFFLNINTQIEMACDIIKADENLKG